MANATRLVFEIAINLRAHITISLDLVGLAILRRVNHSLAYQTEDGTDTNRIESFFARAERAHVGIHHRFSVKYLDW
ncbi:transposase [Rhizobium miluonense]|uniref:ISXO2-like transposase domain-containing protein n=1 Tax=Rhizobium miluonense TaxID=411945 RepID=A0A1C3VH06_9HYPH|nr:transposase [Rhizobium miluonense]SCB27072.1 ISXO2-like transposase domain-containing protein [Rhizobium miluonense]